MIEGNLFLYLSFFDIFCNKTAFCAKTCNSFWYSGSALERQGIRSRFSQKLEYLCVQL